MGVIKPYPMSGFGCNEQVGLGLKAAMMARRRIGIGDREPPRPETAQFGIKLDFVPGKSDPTRIFQSADVMIRALSQLDSALCSSIDASIKPVMVLEDIQAGSIRVWLKNVLQSIDDDAIKNLDWKPIVGSYLVKAKYIYVEWANKDKGSASDLAREIAHLASETDVRYLPDYSPPSIQEIAQITKEDQRSKSLLLEGDKITYLAEGSDAIEFNLDVSWSDDELSELAIKETVKFEKCL